MCIFEYIFKKIWSTMKGYVKRTKFSGTDDLKMRVAEASNDLISWTLVNIL